MIYPFTANYFLTFIAIGPIFLLSNKRFGDRLPWNRLLR